MAYLDVLREKSHLNIVEVHDRIGEQVAQMMELIAMREEEPEDRKEEYSSNVQNVEPYMPQSVGGLSLNSPF